MPILIRKIIFLYSWAVVFIGMQLNFCRSQFSGEVWSSLSEELQKIQGEPLSLNASLLYGNQRSLTEHLPAILNKRWVGRQR